MFAYLNEVKNAIRAYNKNYFDFQGVYSIIKDKILITIKTICEA